MPTLDGFHLPGLALEHAEFDELRFADDVIVRVPRLDADAVRTLTDSLISARARTLANVPIERIIAAVDTVARRLADRGDALRRTAETALPAITGYHPSMIALVLDRMSADWRAPALLEMLRTDLGGPEALDRFVERAPGVRSRAFGPHLVTHVFAGNVPGVAVTSLVRALLVRAASLGKTASGEPLLAPLFARALAEEWSDLGDCIATTYWAGGSRRVEDVAFEASDAVVVYGGRRAADDVRARVPAHVHLLDHGPRISFAAVGADVLPDENSATRVIAACARAVATFDQQGCVSPHLVYVERGAPIPPQDFAERLAAALADVEAELPRGTLTPAEAAAIHDARGAAEFRAIGGADIVVHAGPGTSYTVVYDADAAFEPSCLNRFVRVKPVPRLEDLADMLLPYRDVLQSAGVAVSETRMDAVAAALGAAGVTRVASLERLPWPPPAGHHDGRGPLAELVRWTDLEA